MNKRIVVFSPHPDDETLGCGGTILKKIHEGYEVTLVVLTDGRHALSALFGINSNPTPEEMMQIRKNELINVAKILGVPRENLLHLSFEDGTVEQNKQEIAQIVLEILSKSEPQEIYFPYEQDFHRDHQLTSQIVKSCVRKF